MFFVAKGTPDGFELQLTVSWKPTMGFFRNALMAIGIVLALLSTPVGIAVLGSIRSLLRAVSL